MVKGKKGPKAKPIVRSTNKVITRNMEKMKREWAAERKKMRQVVKALKKKRNK